jgi:hypothetical protein
MKESVSKLKVFYFSSLILTAICVALFTLSMFIAFDTGTEYFNTKSPITHIQTLIAVISVLFFASTAFFIPKNTLPEGSPSGVILTVFSSLVCGFIYISNTVLSYTSVQNVAGINNISKYIFLAMMASGLIAALYFIYSALAPDSKGLALKVFSAIFVIVNLILTIIYEHLDYFVPINSPRKVLLFLSFVFVSMFIVQELRFKAGIAQPRAYFFFAASSMLLCGTMSVSHLIAHYAGVLNDSSFLIYYLIGLALAFYSFTKLSAYVKYAEYSVSSPVIDSEENEQPAETDSEV